MSAEIADGGCKVFAANRLLYLRAALIVFGLIFIFGVYPLTVVWPSGWTWGQEHWHYLMMIIGIYATLGVFLLLASRNPDAQEHCLVHRMVERGARGHHGGSVLQRWRGTRAFRGDVPALFLVGIILGVLMPRAEQA